MSFFERLPFSETDFKTIAEKMQVKLEDYLAKMEKLFEGLNDLEIAMILLYYIQRKGARRNEPSHQH